MLHFPPTKLVQLFFFVDEQKRMVVRAYNNLKQTFETFAQPDGGQETPAKTCRDLHAAHPDKTSGEVN